MKLSVIVPVFNMAGEGKLNYCMNSLINQTVFQDMEIIAVDDASTDYSLDILERYQQKHPDKVKVITYSENKRQGGAKNEGLQEAQGEWVGFIDSDDWVTPDYYEKLLRKAESTGADMVGCDYSLVTEHTMKVGQVVPNNTADQTGILDEEKHKKLIMRPGSMVVKIYRRSVIVENSLNFPEKIFYEDNCAGCVWSLCFRQFERVDEPLYYYYQHDVSTVHLVTEEKCRDRMSAGRLLYEECLVRGFLNVYKKEIEYRFTELFYVNTLFSYMLGMRRPRLSFVKALGKEMKEFFPNFQDNPYYQQFTRDEEKRMIALKMRSVVRFFLLYRLKTIVRNWKKRRLHRVDNNSG